MRKSDGMGFLKKRWGTILIALLVGAGLGVLCGLPFNVKESHRHSDTHEREPGSSFKFVSPLLACEEAKFDHIGNDELLALEKALNAYIAEAKVGRKVGNVAVYFRQLRGGPWVGIQEDSVFIPGSLLKVPLAMAVYEVASKNPGFLDASVFFESGDATQNQYFKNTTVVSGEEYKVRELVDKMLIHSDNNAAELLAATLSDEQIADTYERLGIAAPLRTRDYNTDVHQYASFFRILYNATYFDAEDSEHILEILTHATFTQGLVAGVPEHIPVAHKFGERAVDTSLNVQLHDCGIIYHPERPYLLCVMTQGTDFKTLAGIIADISRIAYEQVS